MAITEHVADRPMLNAVLVEAAKIGAEERGARIARCVAERRHDPKKLPLCILPSHQELVRCCDRWWSVIDPHGRNVELGAAIAEQREEYQAVRQPRLGTWRVS
jgi:hypothetical protein